MFNSVELIKLKGVVIKDLVMSMLDSSTWYIKNFSNLSPFMLKNKGTCTED